MARPGDKVSLSDVSADLARRWASQRLSAVQAYGRILADYGSGRSTTSAAAAAYAKLAAEEAVRYPADALTLATDFATALVRRAGATVDSVTTGGRPAPPMQDLEISGPLGGLASGEFRLDNPHDRASAVSLVASHFTGPSGETAASPIIEPAAFTLASGGDQLVKVLAKLDAGAFEAGGRYVANVAICGFDEMVLRVRLTVLPA